MSAHGEVKLDDLYQEVILDHNRRPRNFGKLEHPSAYSHGVNPLCGDDYQLYLETTLDGKIKEVRFEGQGCAISKASASMMTEAIAGKSVAEAKSLEQDFIHFLTDRVPDAAIRERTGKLKLFEGVRQFPIRIKCAALIWRALQDALGGQSKIVTTEN